MTALLMILTTLVGTSISLTLLGPAGFPSPSARVIDAIQVTFTFGVIFALLLGAVARMFNGDTDRDALHRPPSLWEVWWAFVGWIGTNAVFALIPLRYWWLGWVITLCGVVLYAYLGWYSTFRQVKERMRWA